MIRRPPRSTRTDTLFPYTTLFRSVDDSLQLAARQAAAQQTDADLVETVQKILRPVDLGRCRTARRIRHSLQGDQRLDRGEVGRGGNRRIATRRTRRALAREIALRVLDLAAAPRGARPEPS